MKPLYFLLFLLPTLLMAQVGPPCTVTQVDLSYDAAGNRIMRAAVCDFGPGAARLGTALTLRVYPNPTDGQLLVTATDDLSQGQLWLYDTQGRVLLHQPFTGRLAKLNLRGFPAGVYQLRLAAEGYSEQVRVLRQ